MRYIFLLTLLFISLTAVSQKKDKERDSILTKAGYRTDSIEGCMLVLTDTIDDLSRKVAKYCVVDIGMDGPDFRASTRNFFDVELNRKDNVNTRIVALLLIWDSSLNVIPGNIKKLKNLSRLELHRSFSESTIPRSIRKCRKLRFLWLLGLKGSEMPKNIKSIKNLESVFISYDGDPPKDYVNKLLVLKKCKMLKEVEVLKKDFKTEELEFLKKEFEEIGVVVKILS